MITFFVLFTHIQNFHLSFEPTPNGSDSDTKLDSKVEKKDETDFTSIDNEKSTIDIENKNDEENKKLEEEPEEDDIQDEGDDR